MGREVCGCSVCFEELFLGGRGADVFLIPALKRVAICSSVSPLRVEGGGGGGAGGRKVSLRRPAWE